MKTRTILGGASVIAAGFLIISQASLAHADTIPTDTTTEVASSLDTTPATTATSPSPTPDTTAPSTSTTTDTPASPPSTTSSDAQSQPTDSPATGTATEPASPSDSSSTTGSLPPRTIDPTFTPYSTDVSWYKAGGVKATGAIWPQVSTVITCDGIRQDDHYTIKTEAMNADYQALIASGNLASPAADAEFSPAGVVTQLPTCITVTPPTTANVCEHPGTPVMVNLAVLPEQEHITWTSDGHMGSITHTAHADEGYLIVGQSEWTFPVEIPVDTAVCPVSPEQPVSPPVTTVPTDTATPPVTTAPVVTTAVAPIHSTVRDAAAKPVAASSSAGTLAFTGSDTRETIEMIALGALLLALGALLVILNRRLRRFQ